MAALSRSRYPDLPDAVVPLAEVGVDPNCVPGPRATRFERPLPSTAGRSPSTACAGMSCSACGSLEPFPPRGKAHAFFSDQDKTALVTLQTRAGGGMTRRLESERQHVPIIHVQDILVDTEKIAGSQLGVVAHHRRLSRAAQLRILCR